MSRVVLFLIALVLSVAVHEFGHAWAATRLGDSLPRAQGRLSLNPIRHIDPIGTLLLPILMSLSSFGVLGWGKPVLTNPTNYTRRISRPTGSMLVSLAGPAMNLLMALVVSIILVIGMRAGAIDGEMADALVRYLIALNLTLFYFNLLPIPPLDGGSVLAWVLPRSMQGVIEFLSRWGFFILLGMMLIPQVAGIIMKPAFILKDLWIQVLVRALA